MDDNFDPGHPLYRELKALAKVTRRHRALRNGAQQHRYSSRGPRHLRVLARRPPGAPRVRRGAEQLRVGGDARRSRRSRPAGEWNKVYGDGPGPPAQRPRQAARRHRRAAVGGRLQREEADPAQPQGAAHLGQRAGRGPRPARGAAPNVAGDSVLRGDVPRPGRPRPLAGHRHGRQRALPRASRTSPTSRPARTIAATARSCSTTRATRARATSRAARSRRRRSRSRRRTRASGCAGPSRCARPPCRSTRLRRALRALGERRRRSPRRDRRLVAGLHGVRRHDLARRRRPGDLPRGADLRAREDRHQRHAHGHDRADAGDDGGDPLQRRRDALGPAPVRRRPPAGRAHAGVGDPDAVRGLDAYGPLHRIQIADDTKKVGFIVHRLPPGDPNIKDTANSPDRFFIPLATPEIWLKRTTRRGRSTPARRPTPPARCPRPDRPRDPRRGSGRGAACVAWRGVRGAVCVARRGVARRGAAQRGAGLAGAGGVGSRFSAVTAGLVRGKGVAGCAAACTTSDKSPPGDAIPTLCTL